MHRLRQVQEGDSQGGFLLKHAIIKNRKDFFGSHNMDHQKCGYEDEAALLKAQQQCDQ